MCDCNNSCNCSITLPVGPQGADGTNGTNGIFGGYSSDWKYDSSSIISSGLANTYFRMNSLTTSAVTAIYISSINAHTQNLLNFLQSFSNSGSFGLLRIFKESDSNVSAYFKITGVSTSGSIVTLTVTYVQSSGSLVANDLTVFSFTANGASSDLAPEGVSNCLDTISINASSSLPLLDTPIIISEDGNYLILFEGDWFHQSATQVSFLYYIIKNGVDNPIGISNADETRFGQSLLTSAGTKKISLNTIVALVNTDTINVNLNASFHGDSSDTIQNRSLIAIKVS